MVSIFQYVGIDIGNSSSITSHDVEQMQLHILECLNSLSVATVLLREENRGISSELGSINHKQEKLSTAKQNVFKCAISIILDENSPYKMQKDIIQNFSSGMYLNPNIGWCALHWAIACGKAVTEEDVKLIYAADPLALITRHVEGCDDHNNFLGHTPISILLMFKKPNVNLLLYFLKIYPNAFANDVCGYRLKATVDLLERNYLFFPLHLAAQYFESLVALKMLIQYNPSVSFKSTNTISEQMPLSLLCKRKEFPEFWDMFNCLLEVNSSCKVVENAISCVIIAEGPNTLLLIQRLLEANPDAVNCLTEMLIHDICEHIKGDLCIKVLKIFIALKKDVISEAFGFSSFPIHLAASCNTVAVVQLLLNEDPGSALETDWVGNNLLHYALSDQSNVIDIVLEKVIFLATKYPELLDGYNQCGFTPYQNYLTDNPKMRLMSCMILAEGHIVKNSRRNNNFDILDARDAEDNSVMLKLPLHTFIENVNEIPFSPVSENADIFRLLIAFHPEAISTKDFSDNYPYHYAIEKEFNSYFVRMLLRGDHTINATLLYNLNYAERRLAMFLAFTAVSNNPEITTLANLRFTDMVLLKKVISFL